MPYLKLVSSDYVVYLKLGPRIDDEWIDSVIEVYEEDSLFSKLSPLWYFDEPQILFSLMEKFLQDSSQENTYELMDDPTVEFSFAGEYAGMILRLYRSFELQDHLTLYFDADQLKHLIAYLKLYIGKLNKKAKEIQTMYENGFLQGD